MNKTKKVLIFTRHIIPGGVERFLLNIFREFNNNPNQFTFYITHTTDNIIEPINTRLHYILVKTKSKLWFDYVLSLKYIFKIKPDIIIYPINIIPFTHYFIRKPRFNIMYDLGYFVPELNAYKTADTLYMKTFIPFSCRVSTKTFSISEATKTDLVTRLKIKSERIIVCPLAVEPLFRVIGKHEAYQHLAEKYKVSAPLLFYAGSLTPRKNLKNIILAFNKISDKVNHILCLTGNIAWKSAEIDTLLAQIPEHRKLLTGNISEDELVLFYNAADVFLYPSLYEGFGLPILEAQACGCPVLTSNVTSCPEVAGDSAHIVNPNQITEISDGILKIISDQTYKNSLIAKGFNNIKRYSWRQTSQIILNTIDTNS